MIWIGNFKSLQAALQKPRFAAPLEVHTWLETCWRGIRPGSFSRTRKVPITPSDARVSLLSLLRTILCQLHCHAFTA
jgi:hypothetical protein